MKPWFEKEIAEADIIKFPEPKEKVIKMPSVAEYPDFISGVQDLQSRHKQGQISQDSYDKLYTELIHRFMKKESFENPWFLREFELTPAQDRRLEKNTKIMGDNPQLIDTFYQQLQYVDRDANFQNLSSKKKEKEKAKSGDVKKSFARMLKPDQTQPEQDHYRKTVFDRFLGAVIDAPGDTAKKLRFVRSYGQVDYINTKNLMKPGVQEWNNWLSHDELVNSIFTNMFAVKPAQDIGPGEVAMQVMSPKIFPMDKGDLNIQGKNVELKGGGSPTTGGRFSGSKMELGSLPKDFFSKLKVQPQSITTKTLDGFLQQFAPQTQKKILLDMCRSLFINAPKAYIQKVIKRYPFTDTSKEIGKIGWYNYHAATKDSSRGYLILTLSTRKSAFFTEQSFEQVADKLTWASFNFVGDKLGDGRARVGVA